MEYTWEGEGARREVVKQKMKTEVWCTVQKAAFN